MLSLYAQVPGVGKSLVSRVVGSSLELAAGQLYIAAPPAESNVASS